MESTNHRLSQNARREQPLDFRRGPILTMPQTFSARTVVLLDQPAQAHGIAAGFLHPISRSFRGRGGHL
jgi:hypothetical protein